MIIGSITSKRTFYVKIKPKTTNNLPYKEIFSVLYCCKYPNSPEIEMLALFFSFALEGILPFWVPFSMVLFLSWFAFCSGRFWELRISVLAWSGICFCWISFPGGWTWFGLSRSLSLFGSLLDYVLSSCHQRYPSKGSKTSFSPLP